MKIRLLFSSLVLLMLPAAGLLSCGNGGGDGAGSLGSPAPYIYAEVLSFPSTTQCSAIQNVYVLVQDDSSGMAIDTASVLVNGATITYDYVSMGYVGSVAISSGSNIQVGVTVDGRTYSLSSTQFSSFPVITYPTAGAPWSFSRDHTVHWTGGGPTTSATYGLGVLDAADPNGNLVWPWGGYLQDVPISMTSSTVPAYELSVGDRIIIAGIWREEPFPGATLGSSIVIGGFDAVPVSVIWALSDVVTSVGVSPAAPLIGIGDTVQLSAIATFDNSTTADLSSLAAWSTTDASIVSVDHQGHATATGTGTATITATVSGVSGTSLVRSFAGMGSGAGYPVTVASAWLADTAIGDLNGDGRNDIAVLEFSGSRVFLYHQDPAGTYAVPFSLPQVLTTELTVRGVAIKDVNNDGLADLILSGNSTTAVSGPLGRVAIYRQSAADHTLDAPMYYALSINDVGSFAAGDLNSDGLADIVTAGTGSGGGGLLSLLFQGGGGSLTTEVTYTGVGVYRDGTPLYGEVHVADMNNDGMNDIVLQSGAKELAVIKQTSAGSFSATPDLYTVQTSYWPYFLSFALGDLNSDGLTDIAVADPGNSGKLNLFLQNVGGSLDRTILEGGKLDIQGEVDIADMDGDGLNDLIILYGGDMVQIYYQSTDHTFVGPLTYRLPTSSSGGTLVHQAMTVGDVNNDGLADIVSSWANEGLFMLPRKP